MTQQNGEPLPGGENELRYDLAGDGLQIVYSQVTIANNGTTESLDYKGPFGQGTFTGKAIRSQTSEFGTLLTVTLQIILATGEETTLTLLLPTVHPTLAAVPINTLAIWTRSVNATAGPPVEGQLQTYQVYILQGKRSFIPHQ